MPSFLTRFAPLLFFSVVIAPAAAVAGPDETVRSADQVLSEIMAIPARRIPEMLLAEAQGVVVVPSVLKIGFVAGIRRGHGIVMVRDNAGNWTLPQFVTLTGGSVGWQAGVQGSDVVLVFMTRKSIDGLLNGKFTIGGDASVAAGPVGRNAAAATDARLRAEILSYSRSRGLFAGIALDGTVIEIDGVAHREYYGSHSGEAPVRTPQAAMMLHEHLTRLQLASEAAGGGQFVQPQVGPTLAVPTPAANTASPGLQELGNRARELNVALDDGWRAYLAIPNEVLTGNGTPSRDSLERTLARFDRVAKAPEYRVLGQRADFRATHEALHNYLRAEAPGVGSLPPPPRDVVIPR
jgi:SH3 domain-containing YSC84-like protein 1